MPEGQSRTASTVGGIADEGEVEGVGECFGLEHMRQTKRKVC